jgi:hypothetical protein
MKWKSASRVFWVRVMELSPAGFRATAPLAFGSNVLSLLLAVRDMLVQVM